MNLPPGTVLLIVLIAVVANIVVLLAVYARHRAERSSRFVQVGGLMSSSYTTADDDPDPTGSWRAESDASDGWPPSRHVWSDANGFAPGVWPPAVPAAQPDVEPFAYPEPTSLEQRGLPHDDEEDEAGADADDADMDDDAVEDMPEMEATPAMTAETDEPVSEPAPPPEPEPQTAPSVVTASARGRDVLTGMLDAAAFEEVMEHEDAREQRYNRPATVIVFELDGLAKLVDRLGPEPGDRIETALGDSIKRLARRADHVARLERGRYAVLLPETDEVAAINYVERIRRACDLWLESGAIAMRLAIGWASTTGDAGLNGAVRIATDRMRLELRRNARGVGDVTPDLELIEGDAAEAGAGL